MPYRSLANSALRLNKTTRRTSESTDKPEEEQQSNHVERTLLNDTPRTPPLQPRPRRTLYIMRLLALLSTAAALSPSKLDRRNALKFGAAGLATTLAPPAIAAAPATVFVAGATGQTGRRVLERLAAKGGAVVAGVRDTKQAEKTLAEASTVVRGAMVQKVDAVDTKGVRLAKLDVVAMSVDDMAAALSGSDALVIATGFVPGNPLKMDAQAHAVDNLGTVALVDAAKKAGVKKVVMVSSILTNGRAWGQETRPVSKSRTPSGMF